MTTLTVPELSLVVLVGASGSGKSTFAARHFGRFEVLSSDHYRGVVSNDVGDQSASGDAFATLEYLADLRLRRGLLTVIDATNVRGDHRAQWVRLAKRHDVLPVAIVFDVPPAVCAARVEAREERAFGAHVVRRQAGDLRREVRNLRREGFRYVHHLQGVDAIDAAVVERPRPWTDRRDDHGPFDLIGDVHGCIDELLLLLDELGYTVTVTGDGDDAVHAITHPEGRRPLFLGDLVDRGPGSDRVLHLVMDLVDAGTAVCIPGNHEAKLHRWLTSGKGNPRHGLQATIDQLAPRGEAFRERVARFIDGLVSHYVLDDGKLVVAHAGMKEAFAGRASGRVRAFALYGETTGESDEYGLPIRYPWARDYRGQAAVVYGHTPIPVATWENNTLCIDTGCVFGGELTALRWPERELVSVPAAQVYCEPVRPLQAEPAVPARDVPDALDVTEVRGRRLATRLGVSVPVTEAGCDTAIEVLSRFAEHPRWLVHLPPTMAPCVTSKRPDLLEHPDEAFAYFRKRGVRQVVCEDKHMGSRALVIVGRDADAIARRFGLPDQAQAGRVLSRRGRRFFSDDAVEAALLARVRSALDAAGFWETFATDWVLLDAELLPWSAKARELLRTQYGPVGTAGRAALAAASAVIAQAAARTVASDGDDLAALGARTATRADALDAYTAAWRRYCWDVDGVDDLRLAPFHLLATEGHVHTDKDHVWHMETLTGLCAGDPILRPTTWRLVDLDDAAAVQAATDWWVAHTAAGGEGMVVKPRDFLARHEGRLIQPALKVRGQDYLRIIYGPEYLLGDHLDRLRSRSVRRKSTLALQELAAGLEALERFVAGEPLPRVHAGVVAVLAAEAEAVDPRL
ncbi:MAG: polynucleotide kinase-phosphatase [Alphaproteobacteria bacterium]|nr:polynucleotide kinase-phosphatase [Alphaproteobacteria bacterium]